MGLTSEQAHWIVGGELSALALVSMLYETRMWRFGALRFAPAARGAAAPRLGPECGPFCIGERRCAHVDTRRPVSR